METNEEGAGEHLYTVFALNENNEYTCPAERVLECDLVAMIDYLLNDERTTHVDVHEGSCSLEQDPDHCADDYHDDEEDDEGEPNMETEKEDRQ